MISQLLVLALALRLSVSLPAMQRGSSSSSEEEPRRRLARKVGNLNITSTPEQYMRDLYEDYEHPSHDLDRPTDIWCFPDKGELSHPNARLFISSHMVNSQMISRNAIESDLIIMLFCIFRYCQGQLP